MTKENLSQSLQIASEISGDELDAHINLLPGRYFTQTDHVEVALHLGMVNRLLQNISGADSLSSLRPVIEWRGGPADNRSAVHVVTWDRAGLFYKLAGALSVAGYNILSARITTRRDHIAIDSFEIEGEEEGNRACFARTVEDSLMHHRDLAAAIAERATRSTAPRSAHSPSVEVYAEVQSPRVIVEMHGPDRVGLLYRVGRIISEAGLALAEARVQTELGRALDRFHLEATNPTQVAAPRLLALRDALLQACG